MPTQAWIGSLKGFLQKYRTPLQITLALFFMVVIFFALKDELKQINMRDIEHMVSRLAFTDWLVLLAGGLAAFSCCALYDLLFARYFHLDLPKWRIFSIGWIAQSFNNFVGFAGLTGGALRLKLYTAAGADEDQAYRLSAGILASTLLGLFMMALPASFALVSLGKITYLPFCLILFALCPLYLFGDQLPILRHNRSPLAFLSRKMRLETLLLSAGEWLVAALYFSFVLHYFARSIPVSQGILVYTVATIIGILSMVPGGLGTFDATVLALFAGLGHSPSEVVMALLAERLIYTLLPWLIGLLTLIIQVLTNRLNPALFLRVLDILPRMLSVGIAFCGLLLLFSAVLPTLFWRIHVLAQLMPLSLALFSRGATILLGILLIIVARGIDLRLRHANTVAIWVLLFGMVTSLLVGLDIILAAILLFFIVVLILARPLFTQPSIPVSRPLIIKLSLGLILVMASYTLFMVIWEQVLHRPFINSLLYEGAFVPGAVIFFLLLLAITLATLATRRRYLTFTPPGPDDQARFEALVDQYGAGPFGHLFYMKDTMVFFASSGTVCMLCRPYKNHIFVLGDPIGEPADVDDAISELILRADDLGMMVSFYSTGARYLTEYINEGFRFLKLGENATVDLTSFTLSGKKNRGLRHTRSVMEKEGFYLRRTTPPHSLEQLALWQKISDEWLGNRHELRFSLGSFDPAYLQQSAVFELCDASGRVQAFATEVPDYGDGTLSIDLMRYSKTAADGVMDMLFIGLFEWAKEAGYRSFDLGSSPLANVGTGRYSGRRDKLIRTAYQFSTSIYSFSGLHRYKSKFRPNWTPVFLVYPDSAQLATILLYLVLLINYSSTTDQTEGFQSRALGDTPTDPFAS
ncbi:bifunctional lysylphosphatidylglycerol flippase/synthetase MprF [Peptococcus simiae]|uniref:bifunctional lysylphosphatidylglycerol flippase/synthetase MprF n=1 Tax=Peptococcus simiae TaxID=1643805 RepID=UPI003980F4F6